jgi:hypothetical protein
MNIFLETTELKEIKPVGPSEDEAIVITPEVGKRGEEVSDIQKEIVALDAIISGPAEAARINGVSQPSASKYKDTKDISNPDVRARINATKHQIEDKAVAKLMETLNLINPHAIDKPRDQIALVSGLSTLVEKISNKEHREGLQSVHLHLYAPNQKKEQDYEVIEA